VSEHEVQQINRYKSKEAASLTLLGKVLLRRLIADCGLPVHALDSVIIGQHGKPYLKNKDFHFNISHSKGAVVCAVNTERPLGIDIERVRPIAPQKFGRFFTPRELAYIGQNETRFFMLWSKKEALLKADGRGISMEPAQVEVLSDHTVTDLRQDWHLTRLNSKAGYPAHLATSFPAPSVINKMVLLSTLLGS
jgi:4'-phosphopantetheinyl transferase